MSENGLQSISFHSQSISLFASHGWEGECVPDHTHTCAGTVHDCRITEVTHFVDNLSVKIIPTGLKANTLWK